MKLNYIGIIGAILAFVSIALPWWTMSMSATAMEVTFSADVSVYLYQASASAMGVSQTVTMELWFGWAALALVVLGGVLGIVGGAIPDKGKMVLVVGGILALLSIVIFAVGLQTELSKAPPVSGFPGVGLFSSGSYNFMGASMNYSTYLSFGFWLALVAMILMFVAIIMKPKEQVAQPPSTPSEQT